MRATGPPLIENFSTSVVFLVSHHFHLGYSAGVCRRENLFEFISIAGGVESRKMPLFRPLDAHFPGAHGK